MEPTTTQQRADRAVTEQGRAASERIASRRAEINRESATPITAPDVSSIEAPAQPIATPDTTPSIGSIEQYTSITPEMLQQQRELARSQKQVREQGEDIYESMLGLATRGAETIRAEEEAGIPQLSTQLVEVENEIASKTLQFRRERERIEMGTGLSASQKNASLAAVAREQNRELADLETIRAARSNTLTNAQNLVDRKIELEFGDKMAQIQALNFIYNENKDVLTKEQDKLLQQTIKREERAFEVAKTQFVQLENEKAKYLTNAAQSGADNNTLKTIQSAQSLDELYGMEGIQRFALSPAEKLDMDIRRRQYQKLGIELQSAEDARIAAENARKNGTLTEDQYKIANDLRSEVNGLEEVKNAKNLEGDTAALIAALDQENGVGDIAAINSFQRLVVDPGVAVREGDVALLQSAQSFTDQAVLRAKGLMVGDKLTPEARQQMRDLVRNVYNFRVDLVDQNTEQVRTIAQEQGIDYGKYIGRNYQTFEELQAQVTPQDAVQFGVDATDSYVNDIIINISNSPDANPFGVSLE